MAEGPGFEPGLTGPEPVVLPLDDPSVFGNRIHYKIFFTGSRIFYVFVEWLNGKPTITIRPVDDLTSRLCFAFDILNRLLQPPQYAIFADDGDNFKYTRTGGFSGQGDSHRLGDFT